METQSDSLNRLQIAHASISSSQNNCEEILCPSCDAKLKPYEVSKHCEEEIKDLQQMSAVPRQCNECEENSDDRKKPWSVFQRVQRNRQARLKRIRKRQTPPVTEHPCPICNENFSQDEIQSHTERCLRRTNPNEDNSSNDEDETDEYEEYEWAGQKRIRVSSLLQGGYASIGVGQSVSSNGRQCNENNDDDEEDLNVDEDDTQIYGPAQYGENDVIPSENEQNAVDGSGDVTNYMRRLITGSDAGQLNSNKCMNDNTSEAKCKTSEEASTSTSKSTSDIPNTAHYQQIIDSLKEKLRQYEKQVQSKFKCLICLDEYRNPAISVSCWHVHCEECWLRSLGARKLCPQCNLITTPKDLRRIYM